MWKCECCALALPDYKSLDQHKRVKHGKRFDLRLWIGADLSCRVCKTVFGTSLRVIAHLSDSRCQKYVRRWHDFLHISTETTAELDRLDLESRNQARKAGHPTPLAKVQARRVDGRMTGRTCVM